MSSNGLAKSMTAVERGRRLTGGPPDRTMHGAIADELAKGRDDEIKLMRAYKATFSTPEGRMVYDHIVNKLCGIDRPIVMGGDSPDEKRFLMRCTAYDLGREIERMTLTNLEKPKDQPIVETEPHD